MVYNRGEQMTEKVDTTVDEFVATMKWSDDTPEYVKTLVICNVRGYYSFLKESGKLLDNDGKWGIIE